MTEKPKMSSVEFGALWLTYHKKGVILRMLEYFIEKASDPKAKELMSGLREQLHKKTIEMKTLMENEGAVPPEGFTKKDVILEAPTLWENGFDIMFSRILKEISLGLYANHIPSTYRKDIIMLYSDLTKLSDTIMNISHNIFLKIIFYPDQLISICQNQLIISRIRIM
jgi:hypothetical protein